LICIYNIKKSDFGGSRAALMIAATYGSAAMGIRKSPFSIKILIKVLPYPSLGNNGGFTVMLGLEYGFAKNQSIGGAYAIERA
jgi:hypothetical protein